MLAMSSLASGETSGSLSVIDYITSKACVTNAMLVSEDEMFMGAACIKIVNLILAHLAQKFIFISADRACFQ